MTCIGFCWPVIHFAGSHFVGITCDIQDSRNLRVGRRALLSEYCRIAAGLGLEIRKAQDRMRMEARGSLSKLLRWDHGDRQNWIWKPCSKKRWMLTSRRLLYLLLVLLLLFLATNIIVVHITTIIIIIITTTTAATTTTTTTTTTIIVNHSMMPTTPVARTPPFPMSQESFMANHGDHVAEASEIELEFFFEHHDHSRICFHCKQGF